MYSLEEFYQDQLAKTSPVHKPAFDMEFQYQLSIVSPTTAVTDFPHENNDKFADLKYNPGIDDIITSYEKIIQREPKKICKKKSNNVKVFRPFASIEATELAVHQMRSIIAKSKRKKAVALN